MGTGGSSSHGRGGGPPMRNAQFGRDPMLPGYREFATQREAIDYHTANNFSMDRWRNGLTGDERQGIRNYTDYWYIHELCHLYGLLNYHGYKLLR